MSQYYIKFDTNSKYFVPLNDILKMMDNGKFVAKKTDEDSIDFCKQNKLKKIYKIHNSRIIKKFVNLINNYKKLGDTNKETELLKAMDMHILIKLQGKVMAFDKEKNLKTIDDAYVVSYHSTENLISNLDNLIKSTNQKINKNDNLNL